MFGASIKFGAPEKCPLRFLVPGSFYTFWTLLVRLGVFQITWKWFGRHVGNENAARRGRSWILLRKEVWYLHCWFCSATEPVSVPGVPKNQGVLNIQFLWMDLASSLLVFCGRKGPCDQQDRHQLTSCKGREAVFNYIWSWWEISYSFRISDPPRNILCMPDYSTHEFFQK